LSGSYASASIVASAARPAAVMLKYFYVHAGAAFSPNFHIRFSHAPTLLDCQIGLADAPPDRHVGGAGAAFAA
jgi:hypothetical protein